MLHDDDVAAGLVQYVIVDPNAENTLTIHVESAGAVRSATIVTQAEAHVLAYLVARNAARINEIHEEFGHRRSTLTSVLDRLVRRKLVRRTVDSEDRRSVVVTLTRSGTALATKVFGALREFETRALAGISPVELEAFRRVVDRFRTVREHGAEGRLRQPLPRAPSVG